MQTIEQRWTKPEYEVLCVIGHDGHTQQIARLEYRGRMTWKTRAAAERHARQYAEQHKTEAYVSEC